jgi:hypothetical protein
MCAAEPSNPLTVLQPYIPSASSLLTLPIDESMNVERNKNINAIAFFINVLLHNYY